MQKARVGGIELGYELSGEGEGTIVFLNGIAMSVGNWRTLAAILASGMRVLLHDFR